MHNLLLHGVGQAGGETVQVELIRAAPLRFNENLVAVFLRKAHHFVLNTGAITGAGALNHAAEEGAGVQVFADDVVRALVRVGGSAGELLQLKIRIRKAVQRAVGLRFAVQHGA